MLKYLHVCLEAFGYALPETAVSSVEIERELSPIYERFGLHEGRLELMTGIRERRFWDEDTVPSDGSTQAGRRALEGSGVAAEQIECLLHTSVSRDCLEPATASVVHDNLGLPTKSVIYDISNACLGFLNGITSLANMIELGQVKRGLVVAGESSRQLVRTTITQLLKSRNLTRRDLKAAFASLTIGSGAVALVMTHDSESQTGHRLLGGAVRTASHHNDLCRGSADTGFAADAAMSMRTDAETLLEGGCRLASETWTAFKQALNWTSEDIDRSFCHQVGAVHRDRLYEAIGVDPGEGLFDVRFSRQRRLGVVAVDDGHGRGARSAAAWRKDRHARHRQWAEQRDAGRAVVATRLPSAPNQPQVREPCGEVLMLVACERWGERIGPDSRLAGLGELYPFDSHYLDIGGVRMHYVDEGSGPPVVMLHGNPTWSFYYRELIKGLRNQYRVIAPDHIGCGLSDKPPDYSYTLATHIDNLERLIHHLNLDDVTLAGHDWGGAIGFGWAARHPHQVKRFVVFNTSAFFGRMPIRIRICRWPILGNLLVRRLNLFVRGALWMASGRRHRMTPEVVHGYRLPYDNYSNRVGVHQFIRDIPLTPSVPSHAVLESIEAALPRFRDRPMAIFWGGKDFCFNDAFIQGWIERFPHAHVHRFSDAGHYVVEDAHERILPLLRKFLAQAGDPSPFVREEDRKDTPGGKAVEFD